MPSNSRTNTWQLLVRSCLTDVPAKLSGISSINKILYHPWFYFSNVCSCIIRNWFLSTFKYLIFYIDEYNQVVNHKKQNILWSPSSYHLRLIKRPTSAVVTSNIYNVIKSYIIMYIIYNVWEYKRVWVVNLY